MKSELSAPEKIRGESHPVRGAWVEIAITEARETGLLVAPREGCVG